MKRHMLLLILIALLAASLPGYEARAGDENPGGESQRLEILGRRGGWMGDVLPLAGGDVVAGQGGALVRLRPEGGAYAINARLDLGHGTIRQLERAGDRLIVLSEDGLSICPLPAEGIGAPLDFVPGGGNSFAVSGSLIALASGEAGMKTLRVEGDRFVPLATLALPGPAHHLVIDNARALAFVAAGDAGVVVVDIADPAAPAISAAWPAIAPATAIARSGVLTAVALEDRVVILDPALGGNEPLGIYAPIAEGRRMAAGGDTLYVADARDGLKILWPASPGNLLQTYGEYNRPAADIYVDGQTAYLVGESGLRIIDVSSRFRPLELGSLALPGSPEHLFINEGIALISLGEDGLAIADTANLASPQLLGRAVPGEVIPGAVVHAATRMEGFTYVAAGDAGLLIYDQAMAFHDQIALPGPALDIARAGTGLYIAAGEAGLVAVDAGTPSRPVLAGVLPPPVGKADTSLAVEGRRLYIAHGDAFSVVDIGAPDEIGLLAQEEAPAEHLARLGVYLYALDGDRVTCYDSRANAEPVFMAEYRAMRSFASLTAAGGSLYLSGAGAGADLVALDLSAPDAPSEIGHIGGQGTVGRARASGGDLWLAGGLRGLWRYEISDSGGLIPRGGYASLAGFETLALSGGQVLAAGLHEWMVLAGEDQDIPPVSERSLITGAALAGDTAALLTADGRLSVYSLAGGTAQLSASRLMEGPAEALALGSNGLFVAQGSAIAQLDPATLSPIGQIALPAPVVDFALSGDTLTALLADGSLARVEVGGMADAATTVDIALTAWPADLVPLEDGSFYVVSGDSLRRLSVEGDAFRPLFEGTLEAMADAAALSDGQLITAGAGALRFYTPSAITFGTTPDVLLPLTGDFLLEGAPIAAGRSVYAAAGVSGMIQIDHYAPSAPAVVTDTAVNALLRIGDDEMIAVGETLDRWSLADPDAPELVESLPLAARGLSLALLDEDYLLVGGERGLGVYRMRQRGLGLIGELALPSAVTAIASDGAHAALALEAGGVALVDLSRSSEPVLRMTAASPYGPHARDVLFTPDGWLVISWQGAVALHAVDWEAEAPMAELASPPGITSPRSLTPSGDLLAVAMGEAGAVVLDASAWPPKTVSAVASLSSVERAAIVEGMLITAESACGLRAYDLSQPEAPIEVGYLRTSHAADLVDMGGAILLAAGPELIAAHFDPAMPGVPPALPLSPSPADGEMGLGSEPVLAWGPAADACDPLSYEVYFGAGEDPRLAGRISGEPALQVSDLDPLTTYSWHVRAIDRQGDSIDGPTWQFTTAADVSDESHAPSPPLFGVFSGDRLALPALLLLLFMLATGLTVLFRRGRGQGGN